VEIVFDSNGKMFALVASQIQKKVPTYYEGEKIFIVNI
jgi:hypothetical protein